MKITKEKLKQFIKEELESSKLTEVGDEKSYTLTLEWLEVMLKNHAALLGATDQEKIANAAATIVRDVRRNHYAPNPRDETPWAPGETLRKHRLRGPVG